MKAFWRIGRRRKPVADVQPVLYPAAAQPFRLGARMPKEKFLQLAQNCGCTYLLSTVEYHDGVAVLRFEPGRPSSMTFKEPDAIQGPRSAPSVRAKPETN